MSFRVIPVPAWIVAAGLLLLSMSVLLLDSALPLSVGLLPAAAALGLVAASWGYLRFFGFCDQLPRKALPMPMPVYGELRWVSPDDLVFPEAKVWPESEDTLDWLMDSVAILGVLAPVVAFENRVGQLVVVDGRRRVRAAAAAMMDQVPVFVIETQTGEGQALKQLALNVTATTPTSRQVRRMVEILLMMGVPAEVVAEATGIPEDDVFRISEDKHLSSRGEDVTL